MTPPLNYFCRECGNPWRAHPTDPPTCPACEGVGLPITTQAPPHFNGAPTECGNEPARKEKEMWMIFEDTICPAIEDAETGKEVEVEYKTTRAICVHDIKSMVPWALSESSWGVDIKLKDDSGYLVGRGVTKNAAEALLRDIVRAITGNRHQWIEIRPATDFDGFGVF